MAHTHNGTVVQLAEERLPSGYTKPSTTTVSGDNLYVRTDVVLSVTKATVENSTKATTFTNIIDNATVGIDKQVEDLIANDFDVSGNTVTSHAVLKNISLNTDTSPSTEAYTDTAAAYQCTVDYYVKVV